MAAAADEFEMPPEPVTDLSNPAVADKYREAAKIVNFTIDAILKSGNLVPGKKIVDVCEFADALIEQQTAKAFKNAKNLDGGKMEKGVAFPTCISVNECVGHYSPLKSESGELKAGDMVKIDCGAHIDGFIATAATTVVVGAETIEKERADVIAAAYTAAEVALRLIKPGNTNTQVTAAIAKVAEAYGVTPVAGVLMHDMAHHVIDGSKVIILRGDDPEHKVDEVTFEPHEVYSIDVIMSTGEGKPRELEQRTTVFKRAPEGSYGLKMKASRFVVTEATKKAGYMPFTLRALGDDTQARLGVTECVRHGVLHSYPVLFEKEGAQVAHVKFTALLLRDGTLKVAGFSLPANVKSEKTVPADIAEILAAEPYVKKVHAKKPAAGAGKA